MNVSVSFLWVARRGSLSGAISALQEICPLSESPKSLTTPKTCFPTADLIFDLKLAGKSVPSEAVKSSVAAVLAFSTSSYMPERDPVAECS